VRIVPPTETCRKGETALDWSKGVAMCPSGQLIQSLNPDGSASCATDQNTLYTAGTGLSLTGAQFSADTGYLQRRVNQGCPSGSTIQAIAADGTVACKPDQDTDYTAGMGLTLTGTQFSADSAVLQRRVTGTCTGASSIQSITAGGTVTCRTDSTGFTTIQVVSSSVTVSSAETFSQPCPSGSTLIAGGFSLLVTTQRVYSSYPFVNSWAVGMEDTAGPNAAAIFAVCAS
jgi:hypothetical protein